MTEQEWLECAEPWKMLEFMRSRAGARKLRLVACACCRHISRLLIDERSRSALEHAELYADGMVGEQQLIEAHNRAEAVCNEYPDEPDEGESNIVDSFAVGAVYFATSPEADEAWSCFWNMHQAIYIEAEETEDPDANRHRESLWEKAALDCLFGNPFRPITPDPSWLRWNDGTVVKIARAIYDERRFDDLPILADALEDAGCDNEDILAHCRGPGPHGRGCWVVDLLLGKE